MFPMDSCLFLRSSADSHASASLPATAEPGRAAENSSLRRLKAIDNLLSAKLDSLAGTIEDIRSGVTEHMALLACDSAITQFLPRILHDFLAAYPRVQVTVEEQRSTEIVRAVVERHRNIGIVWSDIDTRGLAIAPFARDELVLIVPRGHAFARRRSIRFVEALTQDFVCLEMDSPLYLWLRREATKLNRILRARIQVRGFDALCGMVESGLGIGVVPRLTAFTLARSMAIIPVILREPWTHRNLSVVYRDEKELGAVEKRFVAFCAAAA